MSKQKKQVAGFRPRAIAALACALGVMAASVLLAPQAQAQIATTKHNLSTSGTGSVRAATAVDEICVFCHTPHGSDTSAAVPLWNRDLTGRGPYQLYDALGTVTLDGGVAPVGSVSIACLSCHDGQTALNAVINAPGSGLAGEPTRWPGTMQNTGPGGVMPAGITNIGLDLRNDHPIGIQYAGGGYSTTNPAGLNVRDVDFAAPQNATINGRQVWWVDSAGGTAATREKSDMILYTRTETGGRFAGVAEPFVECASCHDPHVSANPTFLRRSNVGSALCLTCHTK